MEERIRRYERFIKKEIRKGKTEELMRLHEDMVRNFQHERLVHLLIMLFFVFLTVLLVILTLVGAYAGVVYGGVMYCLLILDGLMAVLSGAYVKHYYFLENHVQGLYEYFREIKQLRL
ncbi:hypothetical protein IJI72_03075 [Candidatus Saccharibacteria bacterium]|nr:hypothetical protein [Candidatus Saccharibacteria bacterium]